MKSPRVLVPVHDRIKNSFSLITVIDGLTTNIVGSKACDNGRMGKSDATSRSTML
jgi:hypothetical protein